MQAFDKKQYLPFIKEAYSKSDVIAFDLDERIDDDTEYAVWKIEFLLNDECIAYITSDYCAYMNEFGWMI